MRLYEVLILLQAIYNLESKILQTQSKVDYDLNSESDWSQHIWNSILKHPSSDECSNRLENKLGAKSSVDGIGAEGKECRKKSKFLNDLETLSMDEVFPAKNTHKEQIFNEIDNAFNSSVVVKSKGPDRIQTFNKENDPDVFKEKRKAKNGRFLNPDKPLSESSKHDFSSDGSTLKNTVQSSSNNIPGEEPTSLQMNIERDFRMNLRSFIFNPNALVTEQFQNCTTPRNETGICRYLQHCMIPNIVSSISQFMGYVCIIKERFIGVCCPSLPVTVIVTDQQHENHTEIKTSKECGVSTNTRIVGGSNADPKAWPWMVALLSKSKKDFFCGGSLINNLYILTAAHCTFNVENNEIIARLGEYDFKDDGQFHNDYTVVEIKRHGHYNRRSLRNDIALLKLEKPAVFNQFISTICLPEEDKSYVEEIATLAGWGKLTGNVVGGGAASDVLQEAVFPVQSNEECAKVYRRPMPPSLICTNSKAGDKSACNGDSGGPLMLLDKNDRWKVIGLVSWGRRGCNPEFPTVYTRVSHFLEWIRKHSNQ